MLSYSILLLVTAIIAAMLGFIGVDSMATTVAKVLFALFVLLFVTSFFRGQTAKS